MAKKKEKHNKPEVHKELEGLDIKINEFGELVTSYKIDTINAFLNDNVKDKKLQNKDGVSEEE